MINMKKGDSLIFFTETLSSKPTLFKMKTGLKNNQETSNWDMMAEALLQISHSVSENNKICFYTK